MSRELSELRRRFGGHVPGLLDARKEFAVLCPLVEQADGLHLLFEVRSGNVSQAGEVCFPGGKLEAGETPEAGALRETWEELAIPSQEIQIIGRPDFICSQRGFLLHPVLGLVSRQGMQAIQPAPAEVAEVFTVPLAFFRRTPPQLYSYDLLPQAPENFPYATVGVSRDYPWQRGRTDVPLWFYEGRAIWGLTGRIVRHLTEAFPQPLQEP